MLPVRQDGSSVFNCPPGFRFHPSDEELIVHYLQNKVHSCLVPASIIAEIDLYKYNPWDLPSKALFGEDEWYFFSPRDRKYPKGERPNRAAGLGYWKATSTDKHIFASGLLSIGVKKSLVFYKGQHPKGVKTEWIMTEYRLLDATIRPQRLEGSMRLDDWVLCRVRRKGTMNKDEKAYEVQASLSNELPKHIPNLEEIHPPILGNYGIDLITDYMNKDCQLLACLLAGQVLPPTENIPQISFRGSNSGITSDSAYESHHMNSSTTANALSNIDPTKTKLINEEMSENLIHFDQNYGNRNQAIQYETTAENDLHYIVQNHVQDGICPDSSYPFTGLIETSELSFTGTY